MLSLTRTDSSRRIFPRAAALDSFATICVHLRLHITERPTASLYPPGGFMALAWHDAPVADQTRAFGPLALIAPLLQRFGIADIIDRHLPPDPQLQFSHGRVLSLL